MDVDVDRLGRQLEEEKQRRDLVALPGFPSGAVERREDGAIAQQPAVDEDEDAAAARALTVADQPPGARALAERRRRQVLEPRGEPRAVDARYAGAQTLFRRRAGLCAQQRVIVMAELEPDLGARQRVALHHLDRAAQLGLGALEELAARRDVEEERPHLDRGPAPRAPDRRRGCGRLRCAPANRRPRAPRSRARRGRRRRSPPAPRRESRASTPARDPRRSEASKWRGDRRRARRRRAHPRSVVVDRDPALPPASSATATRRARVERVLDQLLDHRSRSLDHFAGSDLAHQPIVEESDLRHAYSTVGSATSRASPANSPASSRSRRCVASITW